MSTVGRADFLAAHHRHWCDAELLFTNKRFANADQLYGYCAECGIKAAMVRFGLSVDEEGHPKGQYRSHLPDLWTLFEAFLESHDAARHLPGLPERNPFENWTVAGRYSRGDYATAGSVGQHRAAAREVAKMIEPLTGQEHRE